MPPDPPRMPRAFGARYSPPQNNHPGYATELLTFDFLLFTRLASVQCSERQAVVKQNICNIVGLKIVLTFVLYYTNMFNVRLFGMRAQNKPLYAFQARIFEENSQTRSAQINEAAMLYAF